MDGNAVEEKSEIGLRNEGRDAPIDVLVPKRPTLRPDLLEFQEYIWSCVCFDVQNIFFREVSEIDGHEFVPPFGSVVLSK